MKLREIESGKIHWIDVDNLEFNIIDSCERQMGSEIAYQAMTSIRVDGIDHDIIVDRYEYPEGTIEVQEVTFCKLTFSEQLLSSDLPKDNLVDRTYTDDI